MEVDPLISAAIVGAFALGVFLLGMWDTRWSKHVKQDRDR